MLTRHFYESEDVFASMRMAILRGRSQEALFWCLELIDTNLHTEVCENLIETWMFFYGCSEWIQGWQKNYSLKANKLLEACYNLSQCKFFSCKGLELLLIGVEEEKSGIEEVISGLSLMSIRSEEEKSEIEEAVKKFQMAVTEGRPESAWHLATVIGTEKTWSSLHTLQSIFINWIRPIVPSSKEKLWLCGLINFFCRPLQQEEVIQWFPITKELISKIKEWKGLMHRRKRRVYTIPFQLLYGETSKSSVPKEKNTLERLWNIEKSMINEDGFWKKVIEFSGYEKYKWNSDDELEEFYEKYFPDDIPDEWSLSDQEKSHGKGLNEQSRSVSRWLRAWMPPGITLSSSAIKKAQLIEWQEGQTIWKTLLLHMNLN